MPSSRSSAPKKAKEIDALRKSLDEKRSELSRCYKILGEMMVKCDADSKDSREFAHQSSIQKNDISYLWEEIKKLQDGLKEAVFLKEHYQKSFRILNKYHLDLAAWEAGDPKFRGGRPEKPELPRDSAPDTKAKAVSFSGRGVLKNKDNLIEKHFYCGLDTPDSQLSWDSDEMIHLGGWCCDTNGNPPRRVWVSLDQRKIPCSTGWKRTDVVESFSQEAQIKVAPNCGFNVEVESRMGANFLEIWAEFESGAKHCLFNRTIVKLGDGKHSVGQLEQNYQAWIDRYDSLSNDAIASMRQKIREMIDPPLISILLPTYNTDERWLSEAIESVRSQIYPHWQLCIADDASPLPHVKEILQYYAKIDPRIKIVIREENGHISAATNSALEVAEGSFCALLDHDDVLPVHALYHVAEAIDHNPSLDLIFSDEDKISEEGERFDPYFKSDWNPELFLSHNCVSHLGVYRTSILREIGGFQTDLFGSQDWDLALRFIAQSKSGEQGICHIPKILYHWRYLDSSTAKSIESKPYAVVAGQRAIENYCNNRAEDASVLPGTWPGSFRVKYHPKQNHRVTAILPNYDSSLSEQCIETLFANTNYDLLDVLLIGTNEDVSSTRIQRNGRPIGDEIVDDIGVSGLNSLSPLPTPSPSDSIAKRLNDAAKLESNGEVLLFLSPDLVFKQENSDWLMELVAQLSRDEVGVVGPWQQLSDDTTKSAGLILNLSSNNNKSVAGGSHSAFKGPIMHAFNGLPATDIGHMGRAHLVQRYLAVDSKCFVTKKSAFRALGGFDNEHFPNFFWHIDYCLRAKLDSKLHTVWTPYSKITTRDLFDDVTNNNNASGSEIEIEIEKLKQTWAPLFPRDPYFNPNLDPNDPRFFLNWN